MERTKLESNAVVSAGYDEVTQTLELEFATGRIYQYRGVPRGTYEWLLRAKSKGGFVARMINERYSYCEVTEPPIGPAQDLEQALRDSLRARGDELNGEGAKRRP